MNKMTETAPVRIYLQVADGGESDNPFPTEFDEQVTWCRDSVRLDEVEYIRADLVAGLDLESRDAGRSARRAKPIASLLQIEGGYVPCKYALADKLAADLRRALELDEPPNDQVER